MRNCTVSFCCTRSIPKFTGRKQQLFSTVYKSKRLWRQLSVSAGLSHISVVRWQTGIWALWFCSLWRLIPQQAHLSSFPREFGGAKQMQLSQVCLHYIQYLSTGGSTQSLCGRRLPEGVNTETNYQPCLQAVSHK